MTIINRASTVSLRPTHWPWAVAGVMAGLAAWGLPQDARACTPAKSDLLVPADGSVDVPANTRIWVGPGALASDDIREPDAVVARVSLEDLGPAASESEPVPVVLKATGLRSSWGYVHVHVLAPENSLTEGHRYRFKTPRKEVVFTVGAAAEKVPPQPPRVTERKNVTLEVVPTCRDEEQSAVKFTLETDGMVVVTRHDVSGDFSPEKQDGVIGYEVKRNADGTMVDTIIRRNAPEELQWGAFDLAGNFSGWTTEPFGGEDIGVGCSASSLADASWLGLLGVLAACARRGSRKQ